MSSRGGESPPPETQGDKQLHSVPGDAKESGKGTDTNVDWKKVNVEQREKLESNPKGPLDDEVETKFAKTAAPTKDKSS